MKKVFIGVVVALMLLAIPVTVFLVSQNQEIRKKAAPATTLKFKPQTKTVDAKETFKLEAVIDTGENQVAAAELHIVYDPAKLKAQSITNGPLAPSVLQAGEISSESGTASITVGAANTATPITGKGTIAIVEFKAREGTGGTPISVRFAANTYIAGLADPNTNVLVGSSPATITIKGGGSAPTGTVTPTPANKVIRFGGTLGNKFEPATTTIQSGETVEFDGNFKKYPLKLVGANWRAPKKKREDNWEFTFVAPGTYEFYSTADETNMRGKVIVQGSVTPTATPSATLTPTLTPSPTGTQSGEASASAVTITAPTSNESVASTQPTFRGKAPANATVTLTIYSEPITVVVTADANGNWSYQPTTELAAGSHSVVASAQDASGKTNSASASFTVVAAGAGGSGSGAGSASAGGSGSSSTEGQEVPVAGAVENTLLLMSLGVVLLFVGVAVPIFVR